MPSSLQKVEPPPHSPPQFASAGLPLPLSGPTLIAPNQSLCPPFFNAFN